MVNFHDPKIIQSDAVAARNFSHVLVGIFLWEFITNITFEWSYVAIKKKIRWPLVLYSICRITALGTTICGLIGENVTHEIDCQLWTGWTVTFVCISFSCASLLITIRVIAVWIYNRIVMAVTIGMCLTNMGFLIYGSAMLRYKWSNVSKACIPENTTLMRCNITVTTVTDVAQLIIMLIGLLRTRQKKQRGLLRYMCIQGLTWLIVATIGETPSAVFINLNLNDPWNVMFQQFAFYTMVICATRMYRALILYDMEVYEYSDGTKAVSSLRFGALPRKGTATGIEIGAGGGIVTSMATATTDLFFVGTKDLEINLGEKLTPVGDEEVQSRKVPSMVAHDDP